MDGEKIGVECALCGEAIEMRGEHIEVLVRHFRGFGAAIPAPMGSMYYHVKCFHEMNRMITNGGPNGPG